jgi:hypothetical protein
LRGGENPAFRTLRQAKIAAASFSRCGVDQWERGTAVLILRRRFPASISRPPRSWEQPVALQRVTVTVMLTVHDACKSCILRKENSRQVETDGASTGRLPPRLYSRTARTTSQTFLQAASSQRQHRGSPACCSPLAAPRHAGLPQEGLTAFF